jgi:hypothetical protein
MTESSPRRARPGGTILVAALLSAFALPAAACSSASSSGGASESPGGSGSGVLAYAKCMRSHGITDFPDPNAQGGFSATNGLDPSSPQYTAANSACKSLTGAATPPPYNPSTAAALLKYAECMRSHGITDFPDPNAQGHLDVKGTKGSDLNPTDPKYQAASSACSADLPGSGG